MKSFILTKATKQSLHAERAKDVEGKGDRKSFMPRNADTNITFRVPQEVCDWLFAEAGMQSNESASQAARAFIMREYRKAH